MPGRPRAEIDQIAKQNTIIRLVRQHRAEGSVSNELVRRAARQLGVSERTVWRWICDGLTPKRRPSRRGRFEHTDETLVEIRARRAVRPAFLALRKAKRITCGENAFYDAFRRLEPAIQAGLRNGLDALKSKQHWFDHAPRAEHRNARWEVDHALLPMWIWSESSRRLVRPWLTLVVDCFSRALLGFAITEGDANAPNSESVMAALAEAILGRTIDGVFLGGLPDSVGIDLGSDFTSNPVYVGLTRLGIEVDPAPRETPQDKPIIERALGHVQRAILPILPGYDERLAQKKAA
jgi:putative transposase